MKKQLIPTLAAVVILLALCRYIDTLAHKEITRAANAMISVTVYTALAVLGALVVFISLIFYERVMKERANRRLLEREANVMYLVAEEGQQVYIRETDQQATWRNAHLDVR